MLQGIKDYARSAVANKFTLLGYASMASVPLFAYLSRQTHSDIPAVISYVLFFEGLGSLAVSMLGFPTFNCYRKMRSHIEKHGRIDERFEHEFSTDYCVQIGIKMATKEAGLEI